jgi:capsular polysaccharide biosynthesis protein
MDLWTIIKIVVRRWYLSVPLLLLTGAVGYQAVSSAAPLYQTTATVLLVVNSQVPPTAGGPVTPGASAKLNPYLSFNGSLSITANAVAHVIADDAHRKVFADRGLQADYKLTPATEIPGVIVDVTGPDAVKVAETGRLAVNEMHDLLGTFQDEAGVPADQRIEMKILDAPTAAAQLQPKTARLVAGIGAVGLVMTMGLVLLAESLANARRSRRRATAGARDVPAPGTAGPVVPASVKGHRDPIAATGPPPVEVSAPAAAPDGRAAGSRWRGRNARKAPTAETGQADDKAETTPLRQTRS